MKIQMFWKWKQQEVIPMFILFELAKTDELNIDIPTMALLMLFLLAQADKTLISCTPHGHRTTPTGPPASLQCTLPVQRSQLQGQSAEKINSQKQLWPRPELRTFSSDLYPLWTMFTHVHTRIRAHTHKFLWGSGQSEGLVEEQSYTTLPSSEESVQKKEKKWPDIVFPPVCLSQVCLVSTGWFSRLKNQENTNAGSAVGRQRHSGWKLRAARFRASDWSAAHFVFFSSKGCQSAIYILGELSPQTADSFSIQRYVPDGCVLQIHFSLS